MHLQPRIGGDSGEVVLMIVVRRGDAYHRLTAVQDVVTRDAGVSHKV